MDVIIRARKDNLHRCTGWLNCFNFQTGRGIFSGESLL